MKDEEILKEVLKYIEFREGYDYWAFKSIYEADKEVQDMEVFELKEIILKAITLTRKAERKEIKKLWKEKCKRMKIMSGDVAIYELNNILDEIKGDKKE
jgi:hypothetical protein